LSAGGAQVTEAELAADADDDDGVATDTLLKTCITVFHNSIHLIFLQFSQRGVRKKINRNV